MSKIQKPKNAPAFDDYKINIEQEKEKINKKIIDLERKLTTLENKESMINSNITKIYTELENLNPNMFKAINQLRTTLNRSIETLSLINDMITKIEDLIFKYRKMLVDIENQKINNFIKLNKETEEEEKDISKILLQINNQIQSNQNPLVDEALKELEVEGYN